MHLTRLGFNVVVMIYLAPLIFLDVIGNTMATGSSSDYYFWLLIVDGGLFAFALWQSFAAQPTANIHTARAAVADPNDEVMSFENLSSVEYIYCGILVLYGVANFFILHALNKQVTGIESLATLIWSLASIIIAVVAAIQFYHLQKGNIVALKKQVVN
jgi:hypothetical protein